MQTKAIYCLSVIALFLSCPLSVMSKNPNTTPQDDDHPQTLIRDLQTRLASAIQSHDFVRMISLQDSLFAAQISVDYRKRQTVYQQGRALKPAFCDHGPEGRFLYNLYMLDLLNRYPYVNPEKDVAEEADAYVAYLLAQKDWLLQQPTAPYARLLCSWGDIPSLQTLYEGTLFAIIRLTDAPREVYNRLLATLEGDADAAPHNYLVASLLNINKYTPLAGDRLTQVDALIDRFSSNEPVTLALLEKTSLLMQAARRQKDTVAKESLYRQVDWLCTQAIKQFPKSERKASFVSLQESLHQAYASLSMRQQVYPQQPFACSITHTNTPRVVVKVFAAKEDGQKKGRCVKKWTFNALRSPLNIAVTDTVMLEAPKQGRWLVQMKYGKNQSKVLLYAGRVAPFFRGNGGKGYVYAVDLQSGQPLSQADLFVEGFEQQPTALTLDGFTPLPLTADQEALLQKQGLAIRLGLPATPSTPVDTFSAPLQINNWRLGRTTKTAGLRQSISLFTDRALYKPGDTVYFKGIVTRYEAGQTRAVPNLQQTIVLRYASNYRDTLASVTCTTNAFGSFSGHFTTSATMMNGAYVVYTLGGGTTTFRLENYVRPTFTIEMPAVESVSAYGQPVQQEGHVRNDAGFGVANAHVQYTVTRHALSRPFLDRYWTYFYDNESIAAGQTTTDSQGRFTIDFIAQRPTTEQHAFSRFEVQVTVADTGGETHSHTATVSVGDMPLILNGNTQDIMLKETAPALVIDAFNLQEIAQDVSGTYTLSTNGTTVHTGTFDGHTTSQPTWKHLPSGSYTLAYQATQDAIQASGKETFVLLGLGDRQPPVEEPFFFLPIDQGQTAFLLGSHGRHVTALVEFFDQDQLVFSQHVDVDNQMTLFDYPTLNERSEPLSISVLAVLDGCCYEETHTYEKTEDHRLDLLFHSFRDKTRPNSQEAFTIEVNPALRAEVLVSIFNASTDRLRANSFSFTPAQPVRLSMPHPDYNFTQHTSAYSERFDTPVMMATNTQGSFRNTKLQAAVADAAVEEQSLSTSDAQPETGATDTGAGDVSGTQDTGLRTDFNETLAFLPHLTTGNEGRVTVPFRTNGLLSTFRVLALGHTADGRSGTAETRLTVQKEVMALPTFPNFLRNGDRIDWSVKAVNLTDKTLEANAQIQVDGQSLGTQDLTLRSGAQEPLWWPYTAPLDKQEITVLAQLHTPEHADAEQHAIALLSHKEQVTKAQTVIVPAQGLVTLVQQDRKSTAQLEVTTPITAALYALPALCTPARPCLTEWLSAYYANNTGSWLMQHYPYLRQALEDNPAGQAAALTGHESLTGITLEETPWASYPGQEAARIQQLRQLNDPNYMYNLNQQALNRFTALQGSDGGFSWFAGMESSYALTLFFLEKMGELHEMGVVENPDQWPEALVSRALAYVDKTFAASMDKATRRAWADRVKKEESTPLPYTVAEYLYVRTAFPAVAYSAEVQEVVDFFMPYADNAWKGTEVLEKAFWALIYQRLGRDQAWQAVTSSLRQYAVPNSTTGCFFPNAVGAPSLMRNELFAHALLLRVFAQDASLRQGLQQWLLLQKKNHIWDSSEGTTDVIYALVQTDPGLEGASQALFETQQHGTTFIVRNRSNALLFASLYEQTVQEAHQVEPFGNGLSITRTFYRVTAADPDSSKETEQYQALKEGDMLHTGDRIAVRMHVENTEYRSFVHLKSLRAACLVPESEASLYQWARTCGYFREIKESCTHFFFQSLAPGNHMVEERFFVTQSGTFNSGFAQIQCLYAPEYRGNSAGGFLQAQH